MHVCAQIFSDDIFLKSRLIL